VTSLTVTDRPARMKPLMLRGILFNRWSVLLLAGALAPLVLQADVVFTNVTNTADVNNGSAVCGGTSLTPCPFVITGLIDAEAFTPTANFTLTDAQVLVSKTSGSDPDFNVYLDSNTGGKPGSVIEQIGFGVAATADYPGSLITANSIATPITLTSGTEYWLVLRPADSGSFVGWSDGGSPSVPFAYSPDGGTDWNTATASDQFQIDGTPITATATPEPSSLPLASLGVLGLLIAARRAVKQRA